MIQSQCRSAPFHGVPLLHLTGRGAHAYMHACDARTVNNCVCLCQLCLEISFCMVSWG